MRFNTIARWILFIPAGIVAYLIFNVVQHLTLYFFLWIPFSEYISIFVSDFMAFLIGFSASIMVAPNGKIVLASIFTGMIILLFGGILFMTLLTGMDIFSSIIGISLNLCASIVVLFAVIKEENLKRNRIEYNQ